MNFLAFFLGRHQPFGLCRRGVGLIVALDPQLTMLAFGVLVGLAIAVLQRLSTLSSDTVIGVIFAAVVAFGLAVVSRDQNVARDIQRFLYGDILTISDVQILGAPGALRGADDLGPGATTA